MRKHSWEFLQRVYDDVVGMDMGLGMNVDVQGVYDFAPMLWLDFLNADPQDSISMWYIYKEFVRSVEDVRDWVAQVGRQDAQALEDVKLFSREDFLKRYPEELKADAERLRSRMRAIMIDADKSGLIRDMLRYRNKEDTEGVEIGAGKMTQKRSEEGTTLTEGISMPRVFFEARFTNDGVGDPYLLRLDIPEASHRNFWFSVILWGMVFSFGEGVSVCECAAPDCDQYFVPSPRGHGQAYHSQRCQNRHYMRRRRSRL